VTTITAQPLIVGGESVTSSEPALRVENPYSGDLLGLVHQAGAAEVERAIEAAGRGFELTRAMTRFQRADVLERLADLIAAQAEELGRLIASEAGKPLRDARGEVSRAVLNCRGAGAEARRLAGHEVPLDVDASVWAYQAGDGDRRQLAMASHAPLGPVLAISPFNFPLNLALHKLAPAVAAGNSIMLKPPPQTPLTALRLGELLVAAGLPPEAVSVLPCAVEVAERLVRDDRIRMLSFTGSAAVGWHLKEIAGKKRVMLELGGKGGVIVDETADLGLAARRCARGRFVFAGQYCIAVQRVLVQRACFEPFLELLLAEVERLRVGDPLDESTDMGPVIDEAAAVRITSWVDEAVSAGATLLRGGGRRGAVVEPTVLTDTVADMRVECEEVFGPVCTVTPFESFDEALARLNDSRYGLQAGVFTTNLGRALQARDLIEAGAVVVNDAPIFRIDTMPFGGVKDSGLGREGTRYAIEAMSELKLLILNSQ
jgi:acyl-CoA reductase-like NAD-dependent aldehyde dehydrogenase